MARIVLVTLYNPGAAGARYVAASLRAAGHDVWLLHFKEFGYREIPSDDVETHRALDDRQLLYVRFRRPGYVLYCPFPQEVTETERSLFVSEIKRLQPDFVAFSLFTVTASIAEVLTERIHNEIPGLPVVWGGLHPILDPEECVRHADIVCTGEGEDVCVELADRWSEYKKRGRLDTAGLWFRSGDEIVRNEKRPTRQDLDELPFPVYGEQELTIEDDRVGDKLSHPCDELKTHMLVFTERGCIYHCSYCVHSILHDDPAYSRIRRRSVENVMAECEVLYSRHGIRHFNFHDEIFAFQEDWICEFARQFKERFHRRGCTFLGYVHPLTTSPRMLESLWDAGLRVVGMGVQTGSRRVAKEVFERPFAPEKTIEMSRLIARYPFDKVQFDLLTCNPFETDDERRETLEFLLKLHRPFDVEPFDLVLYPTSKLGRREPPDEPLDPDEMLFWNMLYFMTGVPEIDRDAVRRFADSPYYREHPRDLEAMASAVHRLTEDKRRYVVERRQAEEFAPAPAAQGAAGWRGRLGAWLDRCLP